MPKDYSSQQLVKHNFAGVDLTGASFKGANLNGANFEGAVLIGANFENASLKRANLENSGIESEHMTGADLSGALSSNLQKKLEDRLKIAKDQADRLRTVFIGAFAFCAYVGPTAFMTKDALVLTNLSTMDLPIINAKVSVHAFFLLSALLAVALFSYLLALVSHFARVISRLPAQLPDGPPLREQIDPWVLGCVGVLRKPPLALRGESELGQRSRRLFLVLGDRLPSTLARWLGPITLGILMYRFFVACRSDIAALQTDLTFVALVVLFLSSWIITYGLIMYAELVDGVAPRENATKHVLLALACIGLVVGVRTGIRYEILFGVPNEALAGAQLAGATLKNWNMAGAHLDGATLSNANLQGAHLQDAILTSADLRHALVAKTTFSSASMANTQLVLAKGELANFWYADLSGSDMRSAQLPDVTLRNANLSGSRLQKLNAAGAVAGLADFSKCKMDDAIFTHAQLNGAHFTDAVLFRADFSDADLGSVGMTGAQVFDAKLVNADLTDATLTGAHLSKAHLQGAFLLRTIMDVSEFWQADLTGATLRQVTLKPGASTSEMIFINATLDDVKLAGANLYLAKFSGATIINTKFTGAYLQAADFHGAHFSNVDFTDANMYDIKADAKDFQGVDLSRAKNVPAQLLVRN